MKLIALRALSLLLRRLHYHVYGVRSVLTACNTDTDLFLSRVSTMTCDIDITNLSVRPSVRHVPVASVLSRPPSIGGGNYDCWGGRRSSAEGAKSSRRRRRDRDAEGVEGVGNEFGAL